MLFDPGIDLTAVQDPLGFNYGAGMTSIPASSMSRLIHSYRRGSR